MVTKRDRRLFTASTLYPINTTDEAKQIHQYDDLGMGLTTRKSRFDSRQGQR